MTPTLTQYEQEIVEGFIEYLDAQVKEMKRRKSNLSYNTSNNFIQAIRKQANLTNQRLYKTRNQRLWEKHNAFR